MSRFINLMNNTPSFLSMWIRFELRSVAFCSHAEQAEPFTPNNSDPGFDTEWLRKCDAPGFCRRGS